MRVNSIKSFVKRHHEHYIGTARVTFFFFLTLTVFDWSPCLLLLPSLALFIEMWLLCLFNINTISLKWCSSESALPRNIHNWLPPWTSSRPTWRSRTNTSRSTSRHGSFERWTHSPLPYQKSTWVLHLIKEKSGFQNYTFNNSGPLYYETLDRSTIAMQGRYHNFHCFNVRIAW